MRGRDLFYRYKKIFNIMVNLLSKIDRKYIYFFLECIYSRRGKIAMGIRYICVKSLAKKCGDNIAIFSNVVLKNIENIEFGDHISIHEFCYLDAEGGIKIGNNVSIAHSTTIMSSNHDTTLDNIPIRDKKNIYKSTELKDDIWIGAGVRIMAGCTIEKGSVIAAGAVVTKNTIENGIFAGIPAKFIKKRI